MSRLMLTPPELAEQYGVSSDKIRDWIQRGELAAVNLAATRDGRPRWGIPLASVEAFEAARSATPPAPKTQRRRRPGTVKEFF